MQELAVAENMKRQLKDTSDKLVNLHARFDKVKTNLANLKNISSI